MIGLMSTDC